MLWKLYVRDGRRGTGIGRRLVERVEDLLPADDRSLLIEHAEENAAAAAAYERLGFDVASIDEGEAPGSRTVWRRRAISRSRGEP